MPLTSPALAGAQKSAGWALSGNLEIGISKRGLSQGRKDPLLDWGASRNQLIHGCPHKD
jgi:hypothetical protein